MIKETFVIKYGDKPIYVSGITTFKSSQEFVDFQKVCAENLHSLIQKRVEEETRSKEKIESDIAKLYKLVARQDLEIAYLRGKITKEQYEELLKEEKESE